MSLSRFFYEPMYSMSEFDRLFDEAFDARSGKGQVRSVESSGSKPLRPRMDVVEDKDNNKVSVNVELPGLKKEDVNIDLHDNVLTLSGEVKSFSEREEANFVVHERHQGKFSRSIPIPPGIKEKDVQAHLENGILNVTFPRSSPEQAPKRISIS